MSTETETSAGEWTAQYWWPDRCWRRVRMLPAAALDWQAGAPADPDRLLAPEPSACGGYAWGDAAAAIVASLAADGPATVNQLAARLGKTRRAIAGRISRPDAVASGVRVIGRVYVPGGQTSSRYVSVYGLPQHADLPPLRVGLYGPIYDVMAAATDYLTKAEILERSGVGVQSLKHWLERNADLLDSYLRGEARQFWRNGRLRSGVWHVAYYRLKPEAHDG